MRRYALIPAMPTPNGRFHLGHMAGPYLKMDVLARHLRRRGAHASLLCGIDAYESHVLLAAEREHTGPAQVCRRSSALMLQDLRALEIEVDAWCDPLEPEIAAEFAHSHVRPLLEMRARGGLVERSETLLYCKERRRYVVGCWLAGLCPRCGADVGGSCCERCGDHFLPEEVMAPRDRSPRGTPVPRRVVCTHLRLPDRERLAAPPGLPPSLREVLGAYLERRDGLFRQTIPGTWGVRLPAPFGPEQIVYSYGAVGYALYLGALYGARYPEVIAPFQPDSEVTVVMSCGIDNVVPLCLGMQGALLATGHRPIDGFLVNWFLDLEGRKLSTSRGYVIGPTDWLTRTPLTSDELRFVLCRLHPGAGPTDLRIDEVVRIVNEDLAPLRALVGRLCGALPPRHAPGGIDGGIAQLVAEQLREQADALDPLRCDPARAARALQRLWTLPAPAGADRSYWWLKAVAVLSAPIMPALAAALWRRLGGVGPVAEASFWERTTSRATPGVPALPVALASQLRSCMPAGAAAI